MVAESSSVCTSRRAGAARRRRLAVGSLATLPPGVLARRLQPVEAQLLNDVDILEEARAADYGVHNHSPDSASDCGHLQLPGDAACQVRASAYTALSSRTSVWLPPEMPAAPLLRSRRRASLGVQMGT